MFQPTALVFAIILLTASFVRAQESTPSQRATADAVDRLLVQIELQEVEPGLTVGQILNAVDGRPLVRATLERSQQIGAPRDLGGNWVQVRLQTSGTRVAQAIASAVAVKPNASPIEPDRLSRLLGGWQSRTFVAVGSSVPAKVIDVPQKLVEIPTDAERRAADRAAAMVIARIRHQPQLAALNLVRPGEDDARLATLERWLRERPVHSADTQDCIVRVRLEIDANALADWLDPSGVADRAVVLAIAADLARDAVGFATIDEPAAAVPAAIPQTAAPDWAAGPLVAAADAPDAGSPLRTARAAESAARAELRRAVLLLPAGDGRSIAKVVESDEELRSRLDAALDSARVFGVDYRGDGSVNVKLSIDGRAIWQALRR